MKICLILLSITFPIFVSAQVYDRNTQTRLVKQTIGTIAAWSKPKLTVVTRDMRRLEGRLAGVYDDHFVVTPKEKKPLITIGTPTRTKHFNLKYRDILQLEAKNVALSFVPDPNLAPFATWDEVSELGVGIPLLIILDDGKRRYGVFLSNDGSSVKLMEGNKQVETGKDRIVKIYMVTGDPVAFSQKVLSGSQKGIGVTDDILPLFDPSATAHPASLAIGAAIGAIIYILPKRDGARVLVYSR